MGGSLTTCRSCGAPIKWAVTTAGRRIPIDAAPSEKGNITLQPGFVGGDPVAIIDLPLFDAARGPKYLTHFASCKDAALWRRP